MEFFQPTFSIAILNFTPQNQNQNANLILSRCDLTDFSCFNSALKFYSMRNVIWRAIFSRCVLTEKYIAEDSIKKRKLAENLVQISTNFQF